MRIVGVVGDIKQAGLASDTIGQIYVPYFQSVGDTTSGVILSFFSSVHVVARSTRSEAAIAPELQRALQQLDPDLPLPVARPVSEIIGESVKPQRFSMTLVALFAGVALVLAAIGIYGVLANVVTQQTHEIGVRIALGASRSAVLWMVLRRALVLMMLGLAIGTAGALAATRVMRGLLYEVRPTDAAAFGAAAAILAIVALTASLVPAWRATRVDPLVALRAE
jgi:putative ABC transport system permease protein